MILQIESGRLGNQLFQYIGLKKYFSEHKLIFLGFQNLHQFFDNIDAKFFIFINNKKNILRFLRFVILILVKLRILGSLYENTDLKNYSVRIKRGIFWGVLVSYEIFFQHKDVLDQIENPPILKSKIKKKGLNWLYEKGINLKKNTIVFMHIRRGDYLYFPSKELPAVLSINWYIKAMNLIKKNFQNPIFILMSDEQSYLRNLLSNSKSIYISNNKPEIDLAIMSFCNSGILSASSFAWWGAFFAKAASKRNSYFVGPKYWIGHRLNKWIPKNFYTKWITYVE